MYGIIISGHGKFSEGIKSTIELVLGCQKNVEYINFLGDCSSKKLGEDFKNMVDKMKNLEGIIFFTDLKGGTPFNSAVETSLNIKKSLVFGGSNIPMIITALDLRESEDLEEIAKEILINGREEMGLFKVSDNNEDILDDFSDGI